MEHQSEDLNLLLTKSSRTPQASWGFVFFSCLFPLCHIHSSSLPLLQGLAGQAWVWEAQPAIKKITRSHFFLTFFLQNGCWNMCCHTRVRHFWQFIAYSNRVVGSEEVVVSDHEVRELRWKANNFPQISLSHFVWLYLLKKLWTMIGCMDLVQLW